MDTFTKNVVRQALIEYVDARAPNILEYDNPTDDHVKDHLEDYVNARYVSQTEAFRSEQMNRIVPRIQAAIAEIQRLRN